MKPKDKAKELVKSFSLTLRADNPSWRIETRQCALLCVDEIIKELVEYYPYEHEKRIFWREVKQEINQL